MSGAEEALAMSRNRVRRCSSEIEGEVCSECSSGAGPHVSPCRPSCPLPCQRPWSVRGTGHSPAPGRIFQEGVGLGAQLSQSPRICRLGNLAFCLGEGTATVVSPRFLASYSGGGSSVPMLIPTSIPLWPVSGDALAGASL